MMNKNLKRRQQSEMQTGVRWETPPVCPWAWSNEGFVDFLCWKSCLPFGFPVSIQSNGLHYGLSYTDITLFCSYLPLLLPLSPFSVLFLFPNDFPFCSLLLYAHMREDVVFVQVWLILLSVVFGFVTLPVWLSSSPACACHILKHTVAGAIGRSPSLGAVKNAAVSGSLAPLP